MEDDRMMIDGKWHIKCQHCEGRGTLKCETCGQDWDECFLCKGTGYVPEEAPHAKALS